jgi:ribosomal protein S18 acetylase RimI-like enzyme
MILRISEIISKLPLPATNKWPQGLWDIEVFRRNDFSVSLFTPKGYDYQTPHQQDEIYIIQSGHGEIDIANKVYKIIPLFDQYREFYGMHSDKVGARLFLKERLTHLDSIIFIASLIDDKTVGFVQLYPSLSSISMQRILILNDLYVIATAKNLGIGRALVQKAIQFAKENNVKKMTLQTSADNVPAKKLYTSLGWQKEINFLSYEFYTQS